MALLTWLVVYLSFLLAISSAHLVQRSPEFTGPPFSHGLSANRGGSSPSSSPDQNAQPQEEDAPSFLPNGGFFDGLLTSSEQNDEENGNDGDVNTPQDNAPDPSVMANFLSQDGDGDGSGGDNPEQQPRLDNILADDDENPDEDGPQPLAMDPDSLSDNQNEAPSPMDTHGGRSDPFASEDLPRHQDGPMPLPASSEESSSDETPPWWHRLRPHRPWRQRRHYGGGWRRHMGRFMDDFFGMPPPPPPFDMFGPPPEMMTFGPPPPMMMPPPMPMATPIIIQTGQAPPPPPPPPSQIVINVGGTPVASAGVGLSQAGMMPFGVSEAIMPPPMPFGPPPPPIFSDDFIEGPMEMSLEIDDDNDYGSGEGNAGGGPFQGLVDAIMAPTHPQEGPRHRLWRRLQRLMEGHGEGNAGGDGFKKMGEEMMNGGNRSWKWQSRSWKVDENGNVLSEEDKSDSSERHPDGAQSPPPFPMPTPQEKRRK